MRRRTLSTGIWLLIIGGIGLTFSPKTVDAQYLDCSEHKGISIQVIPGKHTFDNEFVLDIPPGAGLDPNERYGVELDCKGLGGPNDNVGDLQIINGQIRFTRPAGTCSTIIGNHDYKYSLKHGSDVKCQDYYHISSTSCNFSYTDYPSAIQPGSSVDFTFGDAGDLKNFQIFLNGPGIKIEREIKPITIANRNVSGTIPSGLLNSEGTYTLSLKFRVGTGFETACETPLVVSSTPIPDGVPGEVEKYDPCWDGENVISACESCLGGGLDHNPNRPNLASNSWTALGCIPNDPREFVAWLLARAIGIGGGIAFLLMIWGGFQVITAAGDPDRLNAGKEVITSAIAGLLIIIFSLFLLELIGVDILGLEQVGFKFSGG